MEVSHEYNSCMVCHRGMTFGMLNSFLQEDKPSPVSSSFTSGHCPPAVSGMDLSFSPSLSRNCSFSPH